MPTDENPRPPAAFASPSPRPSQPPKAPAAEPCLSCPYRRDVPSGIWAAEEYRKLPLYDKATYAQPTGVFLCHQGTQRVCAGWAAVHDGPHLLALRVGAMAWNLTEHTIGKILDYRTTVPLFASGAEACQHGLRDLGDPGQDALKMMGAIERRRSGTRGNVALPATSEQAGEPPVS